MNLVSTSMDKDTLHMHIQEGQLLVVTVVVTVVVTMVVVTVVVVAVVYGGMIMGV